MAVSPKDVHGFRPRSSHVTESFNARIKSRLSAIRYLKSKNPKFTILIGSGARNSRTRYSDIDVVRIGHQEPASFDSPKAKQPDVSYVDYDAKKFSELYRNGSLFLYHIFREGLLLKGNESAWTALRKYFRVSRNFRREMSQNRRLLNWLQRGEKFRGATMPYLAHTFRALKNLAIFSLAQERHYIFDKRTALQKAFPSLDRNVISVLIDANNAFERSKKTRATYDVAPNTVASIRKEITDAVQRRHEHANN